MTTESKGNPNQSTKTPTLKQAETKQEHKISKDTESLTGGRVVVEPSRRGIKALPDRDKKIWRHRYSRHHILKDQSLVLQLLPLRRRERRPGRAVHLFLLPLLRVSNPSTKKQRKKTAANTTLSLLSLNLSSDIPQFKAKATQRENDTIFITQKNARFRHF